MHLHWEISPVPLFLQRMNERVPQPAKDQAILPVDIVEMEINTSHLPEELNHAVESGAEDLNGQGLHRTLPDKAMPTPSHLPTYWFTTTSA